MENHVLPNVVCLLYVVYPSSVACLPFAAFPCDYTLSSCDFPKPSEALNKVGY